MNTNGGEVFKPTPYKDQTNRFEYVISKTLLIYHVIIALYNNLVDYIKSIQVIDLLENESVNIRDKLD